MEQQKRISIHLLSVVIACLAPTIAHSQCTNEVAFPPGTYEIGCHTVTISVEGITNMAWACSAGPYRIGTPSITPSYTFTFTPPVIGVSINTAFLHNTSLWQDEISFEVNGAFYPITVPGSPDWCPTPAIITPSGTIGALPGPPASWKDININTSISSLKVEHITIIGPTNGSTFSLYFCSNCCLSDAGNLAASPLHLCPGDVALLPDATQTCLESDDILRYILFSDPGDTLGSILATSVTPIFVFNPAIMQTGVTYYVAAIVGNNLNGNVDLTACLDISNAIEVTWHPKPTVTFSVANPNACAGECTTVTANFTGTAPFTLTYTTPLSGTMTQAFTGNTGTFQVCTSANAPPGSWVVQATKVEDAWCTCE